MHPDLNNLLVEFKYDALNRLIESAPSVQSATQRFYLKDHLTTEIQGTVQHSIMQNGDQLLAQQQRQAGTGVETSLLATDQQRSVLTMLDAHQPHTFAYMAYGYCFSGSTLLSLLGFNGEQPDPFTGHYLLGIGHHRPFNPVLMRFNSPDNWSPFGDGGFNPYAYCGGDPVNRRDPTGHVQIWSKIANAISGRGNSRRLPPSQTARTSPVSTPTSATNSSSSPSDTYVKNSTSGESLRPVTFNNGAQGTNTPNSSSSTQSAKQLASWPSAPPSEPGANQLRTPRQAPALIHVKNTSTGKMDTPYEVTHSKMQSISIVGQSTPNLDPVQASKIIRELGSLPKLGPELQYQLPSVDKA